MNNPKLIRQSTNQSSSGRLSQSPTDPRPPAGDAPNVGDPPPDELQTMSTIWSKHLRKKLGNKDRKGATIAEYSGFISSWFAFWTSKDQVDRYWGEHRGSVYTTETEQPSLNQPAYVEPPVSQITSQHFEAYQMSLIGRGLANITNNNHLKGLQFVMREASRLGYCQGVPEIEKLPANKAAPKISMPYEHLNAIYDACKVAEWPVHFYDVDGLERYLPHAPERYWQFMVVWYFNFGLDVQELVSYQKRKRSLTWEQITLDVESPRSYAVSEFGWFHFVRSKTQYAKDRPIVLPMNEIARLHLNAIQPPKMVSSMPVVPFPRNAERFRETWRAIVSSANVKPKKLMDPTGQGYLLKHFRKTCATWHDYHATGSSPSSYILGHASTELAAVTDRHYVEAEQKVVRDVHALPQPESFLSIRNRRQKTLF